MDKFGRLSPTEIEMIVGNAMMNTAREKFREMMFKHGCTESIDNVKYGTFVGLLDSDGNFITPDVETYNNAS